MTETAEYILIEQTRTVQMERDCGAICPECNEGIRVYPPKEKLRQWHHQLRRPRRDVVCRATEIRQRFSKDAQRTLAQQPRPGEAQP
jgi:hypothetical protein